MAAAEAAVAAGAFAIVLELVPADVAAAITAAVAIPTIGIGAGLGCDGQVLVVNDLLGLSPGRPPRHVKTYANLLRDNPRRRDSLPRRRPPGRVPGRRADLSLSASAKVFGVRWLATAFCVSFSREPS